MKSIIPIPESKLVSAPPSISGSGIQVSIRVRTNIRNEPPYSVKLQLQIHIYVSL